MKKIILAVILFTSMLHSAYAQRGYHHHQRSEHQFGKIVLGAVVLGAVATAIQQNRGQYYQNAPVIIEPSPPTVYVNPIPEPVYIDRITHLNYRRIITVDGVTYYEKFGRYFLRDQYGYFEVQNPLN